MDSCKAVMANCRSPIRPTRLRVGVNLTGYAKAHRIGRRVQNGHQVPSLPPRRLMVSSRSRRALGSVVEIVQVNARQLRDVFNLIAQPVDGVLQ